MYLPYPIIVNIIHHFKNGSFWFHDKVIPVDRNLINQSIGLLISGSKIDIKEEARKMGREVIIQELYLGFKEVDAWIKDNGLIINQITNDGSKWATRIMSRRLIYLESNTYLSHQWSMVALEVDARMIYAWSLWVTDLLKHHHTSS